MVHSGDGGKTSHPRSGRVSKASADICALGEIDELNACVGLFQAALPKSCEGMKPVLLQIQKTLFKIGCVAAGTGSEAGAAAIEAAQADLERCVQAYQDEVGAMRHFIVPGGHPAACAAQVARAVCRRAERAAVGLDERRDPAAAGALVGALAYLNRLSTCLFEMARVVNFREKRPEQRL